MNKYQTFILGFGVAALFFLFYQFFQPQPVQEFVAPISGVPSSGRNGSDNNLSHGDHPGFSAPISSAPSHHAVASPIVATPPRPVNQPPQGIEQSFPIEQLHRRESQEAASNAGTGDDQIQVPQPSYVSANNNHIPMSQSSYSVSRGADGAPQIEVGAALTVPAVMAAGAIPAQTNDNQAARDMANRIADDFVDEISEAAASPSLSGNRWDEALELADERYRALYGTDAYMEMKLRAAKEALAAGLNGAR